MNQLRGFDGDEGVPSVVQSWRTAPSARVLTRRSEPPAYRPASTVDGSGMVGVRAMTSFVTTAFFRRGGDRLIEGCRGAGGLGDNGG